MFGDWNTSYARAVSKELALLPDTEYCFVFWLNGGENDKNTEITTVIFGAFLFVWVTVLFKRYLHSAI